MERKTRTIKIEVYEDQVEDFYGLIYSIKHGLKNDRWLKLYKRMMMDVEEEDNISNEPNEELINEVTSELPNKIDDELIELFGEEQIKNWEEEEDSNRPIAFYKSIIDMPNINKKIPELELEYLAFIKYFIGMIHVPTIEGENPISWWNVAPVYNIQHDKGQTSKPIYMEEREIGEELDFAAQVELWKRKEEDKDWIINEEKKELYNDIDEFFKKSRELKPKLTDYKYWELINWMVFNSEVLVPKMVETDEYFEASLDDSILDKLPPTLRRGMHSDNVRFGFRATEDFYFNKIKKEDAYVLIEKIYDNLKFNFPELVQPDVNDYQLRIITGYVGSLIGLYKDEDSYALRKSKGSKTWRNYLADNVLNYLRKQGILTGTIQE